VAETTPVWPKGWVPLPQGRKEKEKEKEKNVLGFGPWWWFGHPISAIGSLSHPFIYFILFKSFFLMFLVFKFFNCFIV
jgi:hypothetical protein